jgi:hypothetical protein
MRPLDILCDCLALACLVGILYGLLLLAWGFA